MNVLINGMGIYMIGKLGYAFYLMNKVERKKIEGGIEKSYFYPEEDSCIQETYFFVEAEKVIKSFKSNVAFTLVLLVIDIVLKNLK